MSLCNHALFQFQTSIVINEGDNSNLLNLGHIFCQVSRRYIVQVEYYVCCSCTTCGCLAIFPSFVGNSQPWLIHAIFFLFFFFNFYDLSINGISTLFDIYFEWHIKGAKGLLDLSFTNIWYFARWFILLSNQPDERSGSYLSYHWKQCRGSGLEKHSFSYVGHRRARILASIMEYILHQFRGKAINGSYLFFVTRRLGCCPL